MVKGNGILTGVPNNYVIVANFIDELYDHHTVLNCTVQQGDVRTDTVWEIIGYPHNNIIITKLHIFGDGHRVNTDSDSIYGNHMSITAELMRELDEVNVSCGSHAHPRQAKFEFHIKGKFCLFKQSE